jgi:hypothetical protein
MVTSGGEEGRVKRDRHSGRREGGQPEEKDEFRRMKDESKQTLALFILHPSLR